MKNILLATTILLSFGLQAHMPVNPLIEQCKNKKCDISMYEDIDGFKRHLKDKMPEEVSEEKPENCGVEGNPCKKDKS